MTTIIVAGAEFYDECEKLITKIISESSIKNILRPVTPYINNMEDLNPCSECIRVVDDELFTNLDMRKRKELLVSHRNIHQTIIQFPTPSYWITKELRDNISYVYIFYKSWKDEDINVLFDLFGYKVFRNKEHFLDEMKYAHSNNTYLFINKYGCARGPSNFINN